MVPHLLNKYKESPRHEALTSDGLALEVLVSKNSWTIIVTKPNGMSCFVAAGEGWTDVQQVPLKTGERL